MATEEKEKKVIAIDYSKMNVRDLKIELQKLTLNLKNGKEKNTSLKKKLKIVIANKQRESNNK